MATTLLYTFQDACEHLFLVMNPSTKPPTGRELQTAKLAVMNSVRRISNDHHWNYYKRHLRINTEAQYSTGTIEYDHTGGASERLVTLTTGTWPTNAARGMIKISSYSYPVATREGDDTITLDVNINPGEDVDSGTSYTWYRDAYPLPVNFGRMEKLMDIANNGQLHYLSPEELMEWSRKFSSQTTSIPEWYTIRNAGDYTNSLSIVFGRAPSTARKYDAIYEVTPRRPKTYLYSTGTFSCTAGSTTVTGDGTTFTADHVGCVFRASTSSTVPTPVWGTVGGTNNPYDAESIIASVESATSLTLTTALSSTTAYSGDGFTISDLIDIREGTMAEYFQRRMEAEYTKLTKRKDWKEREAMAVASMLEAMSADRVSTDIQNATYQETPYQTANWGTVSPGGPGDT